MKKCPQCSATYDDSQNFCVNDGTPLVPLTEKADEPNEPDGPDGSHKTYEAHKTYKPHDSQPPAKSSCLKRILIGLAVVVVALIVLARYVAGAATYLRVEPSQLVSPKGGGEAQVDIDYDGYYFTINHAPDWVSISEHDRSFTVTFGPNRTGSARQGTVTVQSGKHLAQVELAQSGVATVMRASRTQLTFPRKGGVEVVQITSDGTGWQATGPAYATLDVEGCDLEVELPQNSGDYRQGYIEVREDNAMVRIAFTQGGTCPNCHGSGSLTCGGCGGMGTVGFGYYQSRCFSCGGAGSYQCAYCSGSGQKE